ncbi:transposase domain-containing protein [Kitasatospora sp. HPMI-4]|uniref:transposase domain-containing protein n=1 Tax=Kitasatospora sp. HPMI-4 TaxID=3448443 RepID=UPI003F1AFC06
MYAPGHLGELTQIVDFDLVDLVPQETGAREKRLRLLPARVVVHFTRALALFEQAAGVGKFKATMLDGRVLRSRSVPGLDQEVYALLATYQALIRTAADAVTTRPGLAMERISFTVLLQAATDQVTTATGIHAAGPDPLLGPIGRMVLDNLLPTARRQRVKAQQPQEPNEQVRAERRKTPANHPDLRPFCRDPRHGRRTCITPPPVNTTALKS